MEDEQNTIERPRFLRRKSLPLCDLLAPGNLPLFHGSALYYTLSDAEIKCALDRLKKVVGPALKLHMPKLKEWSSLMRKVESDEAKEAISSLVQSAATTLAKDAVKCMKTKVPILTPSVRVSAKLIEEYIDSFDLGCESSDTLWTLIKRSADNLEQRFATWLTKHGIEHWTIDAINKSEILFEDENKQVFYLNENDIRAMTTDDKLVFGVDIKKGTPDFVFVDAKKRRVSIPLKISNDVPEFFATVIELKGHFVFPGLPSDKEDLEKIVDQLRRYDSGFGPTLMLQKWGMAQETLRSIRERVPKVAVITGSLSNLPHFEGEKNPFDVESKGILDRNFKVLGWEGEILRNLSEQGFTYIRSVVCGQAHKNLSAAQRQRLKKRIIEHQWALKKKNDFVDREFGNGLNAWDCRLLDRVLLERSKSLDLEFSAQKMFLAAQESPCIEENIEHDDWEDRTDFSL